MSYIHASASARVVLGSSPQHQHAGTGERAEGARARPPGCIGVRRGTLALDARRYIWGRLREFHGNISPRGRDPPRSAAMFPILLRMYLHLRSPVHGRWLILSSSWPIAAEVGSAARARRPGRPCCGPPRPGSRSERRHPTMRPIIGHRHDVGRRDPGFAQRDPAEVGLRQLPCALARSGSPCAGTRSFRCNAGTRRARPQRDVRVQAERSRQLPDMAPKADEPRTHAWCSRSRARSGGARRRGK
jgi:hypothetical protein